MTRVLRRHTATFGAAVVLAGTLSCASAPVSPVSPITPTVVPLNEATIIDAMNYWSSVLGVVFSIVQANVEPRLLIRPGTDGLGSATARGTIDGTSPISNEIRSGLVVVDPTFGGGCRPGTLICRLVLRHEIGHVLGFFDHDASGLMSSTAQVDSLSEREVRMMQALYALPIGAQLSADGSWRANVTGESGRLTDMEAVDDILKYNVNALGGASYRAAGLTCRWSGPIRVVIQQ